MRHNSEIFLFLTIMVKTTMFLLKKLFAILVKWYVHNSSVRNMKLKIRTVPKDIEALFSCFIPRHDTDLIKILEINFPVVRNYRKQYYCGIMLMYYN